MSNDGVPWRSANATFTSVGFSMVLRDIETLMLRNTAAGEVQATLDTAQVETGGGAATTVPASGVTGVTWNYSVDSTDTTNSAALQYSGTWDNWTLTFYEKRPRFNAKWIQGVEVGTTAPTGTQILRYDATTAKTVWMSVGAATGDLIYRNSSGTLSGLAVGTSGQVLIGGSSLPGWRNIATTQGNIPYCSAANTLSELAIGAAGTVLTSNGAVPSWVVGTTLGTTVAAGYTATTGASISVPSTARYVELIVVGGGGGGAWRPLETTMYVANTSGGATNFVVCLHRIGGAGGAGGVAHLLTPVDPSTSITLTIGTGGAAASAASNSSTGDGATGTSTTATFTTGGVSKTVTAYGGRGGIPAGSVGTESGSTGSLLINSITDVSPPDRLEMSFSSTSVIYQERRRIREIGSSGTYGYGGRGSSVSGTPEAGGGGVVYYRFLSAP